MKFLKWLLAILLFLALLGYFVGLPYLQEQTKKYSPEKTATFSKDGLKLSVVYSSPSKKGRKIFGSLVPHDVVWRTGANEPTTFTSSAAISIAGNKLPQGTYSIWTIPGGERWTVIFNKEIPDWGVTLMSGGKETTRDPENDLIQVVVPRYATSDTVEQFTMEFEETPNLQLALSWDDTKVSVPINY